MFLIEKNLLWTMPKYKCIIFGILDTLPLACICDLPVALAIMTHQLSDPSAFLKVLYS